MKAGSTSQITSKQHVPIIDIASNEPVGYVSSEYLHTCARIGLVFFHDDKAWEILHITSDDTILALPAKNPDAIIHRNDTRKKRETRETRLKNAHVNFMRGLPTPTDKLIILESFQDYLIIHTQLGLPINTTLRLVFDAMLTEQDLIRDDYNDGIRILIRTRTKLARSEVKSIEDDFFHIKPREFDRLLLEATKARFPDVIPEDNQPSKKSQVEKTLRRHLKASLAIGRSKAFFRRLTDGEIRTVIHYATLRPTPLAEEIIEEYVKTSTAESGALIKANITNLERMIEGETVELFCLDCLSSQASIRISQLSERPTCGRCGSSLLALPAIPAQTIQSLLRKKKSMKLSRAETELLAGARRTADLVLSYGRRAIIALSVSGIGPQTAASILASMPTNDSEFYHDLLSARIHYLTTRELWDRRQRLSN